MLAASVNQSRFGAIPDGAPIDIFTLTNPAGTAERKFGLSAGGGGECEMAIEEISPATAPKYHRLLVKPFTEPGSNVIAGSANYTLWSSKP